AVTASTDSAAPVIALRTGTVSRPRPGSRARRTPAAAVTGAPAAASHSATFDRPAGDTAAARLPLPSHARRQAGCATRATARTTMATTPTASTAQSALTPGAGSATRA